jgi:hypothetical protein
VSAKIRIIYQVAPNFPATDQHPDAERFYVTGGKVLTAKQWDARQRAGELAAKRKIYRTGDARKIATIMRRRATERGAIKARLAAELAARVPAPEYVVDAIGKPTRAAILAVLEQRGA